MKLVLVIPWFSNNGGAEIAAATLATQLALRGHRVEVWTTCCRDAFHDWGDNHFPAGESMTEDGYMVRRFPVDARDADVFARYHRKISGAVPLSEAEEQDYLKHSINSRALYDALTGRQDDFDRIVVFQYLYGVSYFASQIAPSKTALLPALHDEPQARLSVYGHMFNSVFRTLFLSLPEMALARRYYGIENGRLTGLGVDCPEVQDASLIQEGEPYILFAGRKVAGKGADLLVGYFQKFLQEHPATRLQLRLVGGGDIQTLVGELPNDSHIMDLGFVSAIERSRLMRGALVLCNPSFYESFSYVLMEAWWQGVPCLVNRECEVTRDHVEKSNGGLHFDSYETFAGSVLFFLNNPFFAREMGRQGKNYVEQNYQWPIVMDRIEHALEADDANRL